LAWPEDGYERFREVQAPSLRGQRLKAERSAIGHVQANTAEIRRSLVEKVEAPHSELTNCAVRRLSSSVSKVRWGTVGCIEADEALVQKGGVALLGCNQGQSERSAVGVLAGREKGELRGGLAGVVVGREVHAHGLRALVVIAPEVRGDLRTLMTTSQAMACGLVFGVVYFLARRLFGCRVRATD